MISDDLFEGRPDRTEDRSLGFGPEYLLNEDGTKFRHWLPKNYEGQEDKEAAPVNGPPTASNRKAKIPADRAHAAQAEFHSRMRRRHLAVDRLHRAVEEKRLEVMRGRMGAGGEDARAHGHAGSMDMRK